MRASTPSDVSVMRAAAFVLCTCRNGCPSAIRTTENPSALTAASASGDASPTATAGSVGPPR